uniref:ZP domain-containing protein n=1 Tax=Mola mola TaxID=94237 RepID=A0A3Q3X3B3_MOLML
KTCSPTLPWAPREATCEANYMEVRFCMKCISYPSATSDWQVVLQRDGVVLPPLNLSEASKQGYVFDLTNGRLVFRFNGVSLQVNGVPVEVVHATLFSRQSWVVLMVDLVAACSMLSPSVLHPLVSSPHEAKVSVGINGELLDEPVAEERGYIVEKRNSTFRIAIPYNTEGGYRKSLVYGELYEFYLFDLYLEQITAEDDNVDTRLRFYRTLATPLLPRPLFTENRTVQEEHTFTVYLGSVPADVRLAAVHLNGRECTLPFSNTSSHTITEVVHPNNTHGYTLEVPFDDPVVIRQVKDLSGHRLNISFTLMVLPENEPFSSQISVMLDHRPFDYLWEIGIGSDLLSSELAAQHDYIMRNDSQSLTVPKLFFVLQNITLKGFFGTFEILVRDPETSAVQSSAVKTCPFTLSVVCSTDGRMTVVADLSLAIQGRGALGRTHLIDRYCRPKESDDTRVLFSFPLNSCGSTVKVRLSANSEAAGVGSIVRSNHSAEGKWFSNVNAPL